MIPLRCWAAVMALTLLVSGSSARAQGTIASVRWLAACWEMNTGSRRVIEHWTAANGELRGGSRTIAGTREVEGERLRISAVGDSLVYDARPSGQAPTKFHGRATGPDEVTFANPAHDFPQRITYRRVGTDSLIARIEGDRDARRQPVTYSFRRVDCSGFAPSAAEIAEATLQPFYADLGTLLDASPLGLNTWFAKHGRPDFTYVHWATAGYRPPVVTREQVDRAAQLQGNASASTMTDRANQVTIERALVRGDTADVLLTLRMQHRFVDTQGRFGPAGERPARTIEHQRLDRWIRTGQHWTLAQAALLSDEVRVEGKPFMKNGRPQ